MSFHKVDCFYFWPALAGCGYHDEMGRGFIIMIGLFNYTVEFNFEIAKD